MTGAATGAGAPPTVAGALRTSEARFASLPAFPWVPRYTTVAGLRIAHVEDGPADAPVVVLLHGEPSWSYLYRHMSPGLAAAGLRANPFLASLVDDGWLRVDDVGIGLAVDAHCSAIGADACARPALRVIGPPTAGTFGDPLGVMFIAAQVYRMLPDALAFLAQVKRRPGR